MREAIAAGVRFLLSSQADDGSWREWELPPGESRAWPTAYIGERLRTLSTPAVPPWPASLERAATWLAAAESPAGGWGYAPVTGPDADSTALAMAFLRTRGVPLTRAARALAAHQQGDGGFATYTRAWNHGAWTVSQPDVTAMAVHALAADPATPRAAIEAATAYLREMRQADGLWPSYWWTSPLYATERVLASETWLDDPCRQRTARAVRAAATPTCFDRALQVLCLLRLGDTAEATARAAVLAAVQAADGSWPSGPILRLTHRHIERPWLVADAGPVFEDVGRTFATATAVAALDADAHTSAGAPLENLPALDSRTACCAVR